MKQKMKLKELRREVRQTLREAGAGPKVHTFLFLGIVYGISLLLDFIQYYLNLTGSTGISETLRLQSISNLFSGIAILVTIFSIAWQNCYLGYMRAVVRKEKPDFKTIPGYLNRFFPFLGVRILTGIYVALWAVLFMIPAYSLMVQMLSSIEFTEELLMDYDALYATIESLLMDSPMLICFVVLIFAAIIAASFMSYRYRLAPYYALEPGSRASSCIRASKKAMRGRTWELFRLDLSMVGWSILTALPATVLSFCDQLWVFSDGEYLIAECITYALLLAIEMFVNPRLYGCYAAYADKVMFPPADSEPVLLTQEAETVTE